MAAFKGGKGAFAPPRRPLASIDFCKVNTLDKISLCPPPPPPPSHSHISCIHLCGGSERWERRSIGWREKRQAETAGVDRHTSRGIYSRGSILAAFVDRHTNRGTYSRGLILTACVDRHTNRGTYSRCLILTSVLIDTLIEGYTQGVQYSLPVLIDTLIEGHTQGA